MSYEPSDALYLDHIYERIQRIEECAQEGRDAFEASHVLQDAIMRNFEVIGEAIKQLSPALLEQSTPRCRGAEWRAFGTCSFTTIWAWTSMKCGMSSRKIFRSLSEPYARCERK